MRLHSLVELRSTKRSRRSLLRTFKHDRNCCRQSICIFYSTLGESIQKATEFLSVKFTPKCQGSMLQKMALQLSYWERIRYLSVVHFTFTSKQRPTQSLLQGRGHCICKEMPVIPVNKVVDPKRIIGKNGGPRRRRGTRGR
jgi:hypothetical protein